MATRTERLAVALQPKEFVVGLGGAIISAIRKADEHKAENDKAVVDAARRVAHERGDHIFDKNSDNADRATSDRGSNGSFDESKHPRDAHGKFE